MIISSLRRSEVRLRAGSMVGSNVVSKKYSLFGILFPES